MMTTIFITILLLLRLLIHILIIVIIVIVIVIVHTMNITTLTHYWVLGFRCLVFKVFLCSFQWFFGFRV